MRALEIRELHGRTPFVLDDPNVGWIVRDGRVDVFAAELVDGQPGGQRHAVCSAGPGDLLVGAEPTAALVLIGVGVAPTTVERVSLAEVTTEHDGPRLVEHWARELTTYLRQVERPDAVTLAAGEPVQLAPGTQARSAKGTVWVDAAGLTVLGASGPGWIPIPPGAWVQSTEFTSLTPVTGREALEHGADGLATFGRAVLSRIAVDVAVAREESERRLDRREQQDAELSTEVYSELADIVRDRGAQAVATSGGDALLAACRLVGAAAGFEVTKPARGAVLAAREPLAAIAQASDLRTRDVALETDWWRRDSGPLVATVEVDGRPVALLPRGPGRYDLVDPEHRRARPGRSCRRSDARSAGARVLPSAAGATTARPGDGTLRAPRRAAGHRPPARARVRRRPALAPAPDRRSRALRGSRAGRPARAGSSGSHCCWSPRRLPRGRSGSSRGSPLCGSRDASRRRCRRRSGTACSVCPSRSSAATRRAT